MVEACKHVGVLQRHRERLERPPVFRVSPSVVAQMSRSVSVEAMEPILLDVADRPIRLPTASRARDGEGLRITGRSRSTSIGTDGYRHIWTIDAAGGIPHQITTGPGSQQKLSWSHDGRWIYFSGGRRRRTGAPVARVPVAGGAAQKLTKSGRGTATLRRAPTVQASRNRGSTAPVSGGLRLMAPGPA